MRVRGRLPAAGARSSRTGPRSRRDGGRGRGETGSATVLVLVMLVALGVVAALVAGIGGLLVADRRAGAAADLAALAGAGAVQQGSAGCPTAQAMAGANRATVITCHQDGDVIEVEVAVAVRGLPGAFEVRERARAGPA